MPTAGIPGEGFTCAALLLSISRLLSLQEAVGGAEQLSSCPKECGRSAVHLVRVESSSIWLYVKHLHPRAVGATQAPCPILRSCIYNHLPQDSSSKVPDLLQGDQVPGLDVEITVLGLQHLHFGHGRSHTGCLKAVF